MKKVLAIFAVGLALNLPWEFAHAPLYATYQGNLLTPFILVRAALGDALIVACFGAVFVYVPFFARRPWLVWPLGLVAAVAIELWALSTGRWTYGPHMPLIFGIGLTPLVQLALTGWASLRAVPGARP